MYKKRSTNGFTIVELLIVIVIIGILAALIVVMYQGITQRAQQVRTEDSMKKVEKAFRLKAIADGGYKQDTYYITCMGYNVTDYMASYSGSNNVSISEVIEQCSDQNPLSNYLQASDFEEVGVPLYYDNDLDTYALPCDSSTGDGVNVFFGGELGLEKMTALDQKYDEGNGLACGRVRMSVSGQEYYMLTLHSTDGI